jgi:DNA-binding response OmpR family regulator
MPNPIYTTQVDVAFEVRAPFAERADRADERPNTPPRRQSRLHRAMALFRNLARPLSRGYIMEAVWGQGPDMISRTLDAHISQIRNRLGLRPENGLRLSSVYSFGYRLEQVEQPQVAAISRTG